MLRVSAFFVLCAAALALQSGSTANAADTWVLLATVNIDSVTGKASADLTQAKGQFRAVRVRAKDQTVALNRVEVTYADGAVHKQVRRVNLLPGQHSRAIDERQDGRFIDKVVLVSADPVPGSKIAAEIWGLQSPEMAAAVRPTSETATRSLESEPDSETRGIGGGPESGPELSRSPGPAGGGGASGPASTTPPEQPNACIDKNVCTLVDVFFGTDRNSKPGPQRLGFESERANKLTLGHAFVTVPKANRKKGEIPLPSLWDKYVLGVPEAGDPARHFTIPAKGVSVFDSEDEFVAAAQAHMANAGDYKDHAFVFVHGFYTTYESALYRTAQIAYDLGPDGVPFGTAFLYSWPSAGNATAYLYDEESSRLSVPHLKAFLNTVIDKTGVKNVHLIAHSMGNVALIGALQQIAAADTKVRINQIILAAPDVDKVEFEQIIAGVGKLAKGVTLYASSNDNALLLARQARKGTPRAGEAIVPPGPAVVGGIDTIDISAISSSVFSWNHDSYAGSKELLNDISTIFRKGERPPPVRNINFKPVVQGTRQYWRYTE